VNRLRKYIERMTDGRELRMAYAMSETALPDARPRSRWQEITPFSAADEVMAGQGSSLYSKPPSREVSEGEEVTSDGPAQDRVIYH
jgi:hypothetical protein